MTGSDSYQAAADLLREWVLRRLDQPQRAWLDAQIDWLARGASGAALHSAFGMVADPNRPPPA
mgnify:CR=1 FL=1